MFDPYTIALAAAVIFAAFIVKGMTGFASALVAVPLLTIIFGSVEPALIILSLFELVFSITLLPKLWPKTDRRCFVYLVIGMILGSAAGVAILKTFATSTTKKALGVVIVLFAVNMLIRGGYPNWRVRKPWGVLFGTVGGLLGGMFGTPGPPYVVYMTGQTKDKSVFRATLASVFALGVTWRLILFWYTDVFTLERVQLSGLLLPACLLGLFVGHHIHLRMPDALFRRVVALILLVSGVLCLLRGVEKPKDSAVEVVKDPVREAAVLTGENAADTMARDE